MSKTKTEDVEMKDAAKPEVEEDPETKKRRAEKEAFDLLVADFVGNFSLLAKGVQQSDDRLIARAVRQTFHLRKKFTRQLFETVINKVLVESDRKDVVLGYLAKAPQDATLVQLDTPMEVEPTPSDSQAAAATTTTPTPQEEDKKKLQLASPESETLLQTLVVVYLLDKKIVAEALNAAIDLVQYLQTFNRRTLNPIGARVYFYYARCYELNKQSATIRTSLLGGLRTASLRHDNHTQGVLVNLLLRNYIADHLYEQASKLLNKTPSLDFRSNSQLARFFYYKGRIQCIQLDYANAYECFMSAIRKLPNTTAKGFRISAQKFAVIVKLLMGEIPERSIFAQKGLRAALKPYLELTKFVRIGDLAQFRDCVQQNSAIYKKDETYTLIQRIRQNVIRTGLKKISLSYSRISFVDICEKLKLDNTDDVEGIVAKAIKDRIIDATIDHSGGFIQSKESVDVYNSMEPTDHLHKSMAFCLKIHNESVQAMRFPPDAYKRTKKEFELDDARLAAEEMVEDFGEEDEF